jgi:glyoxylase-like metal-dependent hydrolase (beta-lactamase superfamily II)
MHSFYGEGRRTMLKKVTEDIHQLVVRFPFGMRELNSYLLKGEKGWTVIDTGSCAEESIRIWEQAIASGIKIEKLVLTHAHPDHIGLAGWFQEKHNVPVLMSSLSYQEMQKMRLLVMEEKPFALLKMHDGPEVPKRMVTMEADAFQFEPDELFDNHETIQLGSGAYETIWTPGHSPDHFCFYNRQQQVMFIGDHVLKDISPIVGFSSSMDGNPLKDYFSSLELIKKYPVSLALPGHGGHISDLKNRIDEIMARHQHRLEQIISSVGNKGKTARQICVEIYGSLGQEKLFSPFISIITRMVFLESVGKVSSENCNGFITYRAVK